MMNRRFALALLVASTACAPAGGAPTPDRSPLGVLRHSIDSLVDDPKFANANIGLLVVNPKTGDTLYSRNADKLFMPASNQKLLTSSVALTQLGPDYRYRTVIGTRGTMKDTTLTGDMLVIGRGDPTLSDRVYGSASQQMGVIADSIQARGILHVTGSLRQSGNAFPDSIYGYGWEWDDLSGESAAPVDELEFNEGMVQKATKINGRDTVVSVATRTPAYVYLSALYLSLSQHGVKIDKLVDLDADTSSAPIDTVYEFYSPRLSEILKYFLKPSQNQIGEALLKTLALEKTGVGTARNGAEIVSDQLKKWGVDSTEFVIYDGSGMSRHDLVSPRALVKILSAMRQDTIFYNALPIAGVDGTIRSRMKGTSAENNLHAKTGSLEFVRSLSGYVNDADGDKLIFSFLSNHFTTPASDITHAMDAVGALLAAYKSKLSQ